MNPSLLERQPLPRQLFLAATLSAVIGLIPTFALAQTNQYADGGPATAPSVLTRLNGSVTQSSLYGNSNGMRMSRGQTAGQNQPQQSLFSGDTLSSFSNNPGATGGGNQSLVSPNAFESQVTQSAQPPVQVQHEAAPKRDFDVDKALSIGATMFNGFNRVNNFLNDAHQMSAPLTSFNGLNGSAFNNSTNLSALSGAASQLFKTTKPLDRNEINLLSNYDVDIVIDKSGSMQAQDCPMGFSRWDFCREQLLNLTSQINTAFRNGITVALFSSGYQVFDHVDFSAVPQIFASNSPDGGTYLARPLRELLANYFAGRDRNMAMRASTRPLLIEVITDGEPGDKDEVVRVICEATQKMTSPREVTITFLQIGNEMEGNRVLNLLDNRLVSDRGAQYDIVNVQPFASIVNQGLARSLVNAASSHP